MKMKFLWMTAIVSVLLFSFAAFGAGEVDVSFDARAYRGDLGVVSTLVRQPDGKILVAGNFRTVNGFEKNSLARLNADFTLDNTFNSPLSGGINTIAVQPDGKILVGGSFKYPANANTGGIVRLNSDGSIDATFSINLEPQGSSGFGVSFAAIQSDGKIVISGSYCFVNIPRCNLARVNPDGSFDASFVPNLGASARFKKLQPDGKILAENGFNQIVRINSDGSLDASFQAANVIRVNAVELDAAGKIYLGGDFTAVNGFSTGNIARLNPDGSLDATFTPANANFGVVNEIKIDQNGKVIVAGLFSQFNGVSRYSIVRLNPNGDVDGSFASPFTTTQNILTFLPLPDGKILLGGSATNPVLILLNPDGSLNNSPNLQIGGVGSVNRILQQPDGKILAAGDFLYVNGNVQRKGVARFNADGSLDTTFQTADMGIVSHLSLQSNGKILVSRSISPFFIRLNADGSTDSSFTTGYGGSIQKVLPNDKILTCGNFPSSISGTGQTVLIRRLNPDGTVDNTFNPFTAADQNSDHIYDCEVQADGKIVIGGRFTQISGLPRNNYARLNADGTVDTTFAPPFGANGRVQEIEIQSNGKIILGGPFSGINGNTNYKAIARVNTDASLDTTFMPPMITVPLTTDPIIYAINIKLQPDDKILVTDNTYAATLDLTTTRLIRLFPNGQLDGSLTVNTNARIGDVNLQSDGKILIGGTFTRVNGVQKTAIARLLNVSSGIDFDYDGDGKSDVSVFRPSNGSWYVQQSTNGFTGIAFGQNGDLITPADFDGDGKTDISVFRPSNGAWYRINSSNGSFYGIAFGQSGDIPVPGDFDGDGKADISVFRPSNGAWYRINSSNGSFYGIAFGQSGDKPLLADYDGDGKNDIAVFRPSNGTFYWLESSTGNFKGIAFGFGTDIPTPADFDGDGKTDIAVFRASNGAWYRFNSSNGAFVSEVFGQNGDIPVPADYDGDGKANLAVFRPSAQSWYIARPTGTPAQNFDAVPFGAGTDQPTPAAFLQ